jgi:hypothetical protein
MAIPSADQNTSHLSALAAAKALVVVPESVRHAPAGMRLSAIVLERDPWWLSALPGGNPAASSANQGGETQ